MFGARLASAVIGADRLATTPRVRPSRYLSITLGLLLGGAIGNLIDRFRLGYVVDFVDAGIGDLALVHVQRRRRRDQPRRILLLSSSAEPSLGDGRRPDEAGAPRPRRADAASRRRRPRPDVDA